MKNLKVSLRIIGLFGVAIFISKVPEFAPSFFGDWFCIGSGENHTTSKIQCDIGMGHLPTWHWGYQHWLFFAMGLSLAFVQVMDIINILNKED